MRYSSYEWPCMSAQSYADYWSCRGIHYPCRFMIVDTTSEGVMVYLVCALTLVMSVFVSVYSRIFTTPFFPRRSSMTKVRLYTQAWAQRAASPLPNTSVLPAWCRSWGLYRRANNQSPRLVFKKRHRKMCQWRMPHLGFYTCHVTPCSHIFTTPSSTVDILPR